MAKSFESFDKPYRRGLVLGLSLAELFLILIFLLLLIAIGTVQSIEDEKQKLQNSLDAIYESVGNEITPEEFTRLAKQAGERKKLIEENKELSDQLADTKEKLDKNKEIAEVLEEAELEPEDIETLIEDKEAAENLLEEAKEEIAKKDLVIAKYAKKGQDPPCWFINVPDDNEVDGTRERHIKIFDVRIEDAAFVVNWHDNSPINPDINKGKEPAGLYHMDSIFMNTPITPDDFIKAFSKFTEAGEEKKIHDYKCRFMVNVLDATSPNNKAGYKYHLGVVESLFYKHEVQG